MNTRTSYCQTLNVICLPHNLRATSIKEQSDIIQKTTNMWTTIWQMAEETGSRTWMANDLMIQPAWESPSLLVPQNYSWSMPILLLSHILATSMMPKDMKQEVQPTITFLYPDARTIRGEIFSIESWPSMEQSWPKYKGRSRHTPILKIFVQITLKAVKQILILVDKPYF